MIQTFEYVIGGLLIALAIALTVIILMQTGKDRKLSGAITGSSETYFGKSGGASKDKILSKLTIVGSVLFVVLAIVMTVLASIG